MSTVPSLSSMETNATLEIRLPDKVAAQELQALLAIAQVAYSSAEWLFQAAQQPFGTEMQDLEYVPPADSRLQIAQLEIGSPNKLTFSGGIKGILAVAAVLTALIGVPKAGAEAFKTFAEGQKAQAEAHKIIEETELIKEQRRDAERLRQEGRLSEDSLRGKEETPYMLAHYFTYAAPLLVPQELQVKE